MEPENSKPKIDHKISSTNDQNKIDLKRSREFNNCCGRNCDRDVGHEINGGDDDGNPKQVGASWGRSRKSRKSREGQSQSSMKK
jgi:hypothetical protein